MDIDLIKTKQGTQIIPSSIHGMLWLQTHFEEQHWDLLLQEQVIINNIDAEELLEDAQQGGLIIKFVPVLSSNSHK